VSSQEPFRGRRAVRIENRDVRLTVLREGGHIAEFFANAIGVSPLWQPPWHSVEPSAYDPMRHAEYGAGSDASLLATIMGHNLCLDLFGGPSAEEAAAGLTPHGEASIVPYDIDANGTSLTMTAELPRAQLTVTRRIELVDRAARIVETVENVSSYDRPVGWTEHVTLGPPFLERGATAFRASASRSKVFEERFGAGDYLVPAAEFTWPMAPRLDGGVADLRRLSASPSSSAYTASLMDPAQEDAFFVAFSPRLSLAFGCVWKRVDFPWLGIWEENHSRTAAPWNGITLAYGMEFGVSPMPETRRKMIERGRLFDTPTFRWIPARSAVTVEYWMMLEAAREIPERLSRPGDQKS
jgi:hypothetical protein